MGRPIGRRTAHAQGAHRSVTRRRSARTARASVTASHDKTARVWDARPMSEVSASMGITGEIPRRSGRSGDRSPLSLIEPCSLHRESCSGKMRGMREYGREFRGAERERRNDVLSLARRPARRLQLVLRPPHRRAERRPVFFDVERDLPGAAGARPELPRRSARSCWASCREKAAIPRYHDLDRCSTDISGRVDPDKDWKVFYLYAMGEKPAANRARCPRTAGAARRGPGAVPGVLLDPRRRQVGPGAPRAVPGLSPLSPRPGRARGRTRRRSGSRTSTTPGRKARASCSTTAGTTRSSTRPTADRVVLIVDIRRPMPLRLRPLQPVRRGGHAAGLRQADPQEAGLIGRCGQSSADAADEPRKTLDLRPPGARP